MAVTIASIANKIASDASGSLNKQRQEAVIEAIREFAKRSDYFRATEEQSFESTDVLAYENDCLQMLMQSQGKGLSLWRLESVFVDGIKKKISLKDDILTEITDFDAIYGTGTVFYKTEDPWVKLFPFPSATAFSTTTGAINIVATGVFLPSNDITEVDDAFYDRWGKSIESGAKAELMMMVGKPWTNPQMAGVHAKIFDAAINSAIRKRNLEEAGGELMIEKIAFI